MIKIENNLTPEKFISTIRESFVGSTIVYKEGSCYQFYLILKSIFPSAECFYDIIDGHVYTKIDQEYYDIFGKHDYDPKWILLSSEPNIEKQAPSWIWNIGVYRNSIIQECAIKILKEDE